MEQDRFVRNDPLFRPFLGKSDFECPLSKYKFNLSSAGFLLSAIALNPSCNQENEIQCNEREFREKMASEILRKKDNEYAESFEDVITGIYEGNMAYSLLIKSTDIFNNPGIGELYAYGNRHRGAIEKLSSFFREGLPEMINSGYMKPSLSASAYDLIIKKDPVRTDAYEEKIKPNLPSEQIKELEVWAKEFFP